MKTATKIDLFAESCKSPATKANYTKSIHYFQQWAEIQDLLKVKPKVLQEKLIEYVIFKKRQGVSYSTQNMAINAVQRYCEVYDIDIRFDKVRRFTSEPENLHEDSPYTIEAIRSMLEASDLRKRAIVLTLVSTGVRRGAVPSLRLGDLTKVPSHNMYKVMIYSQSPKARYYTFTTPEATSAIDAYLNLRKTNGEELRPEAPLIRQEFSKADANKPKVMKEHSITKLVHDLVVRIGVRQKGNVRERQPTMIMHGFRKFYNTSLIRAGVKPIIVEMLMGHKIGMQNNYLRLTEEEVLSEYIKAVDLLTISREKHLTQEVEKLKVENAEVDIMKKSYLDMKLQLDKRDEQAKRRDEEMKRLYKALYDKGIIEKED